MTILRYLPKDLPDSVIAHSSSYPNGHIVDWHCHNYAQLVYACSGVMTVNASGNLWVSPPQRAVWVPSHVPHRVTMHGQAEMKSLYIQEKKFKDLPETSCVLSVSPLLRELILHLATLPETKKKTICLKSLFQVTIDQLKQASSVELSVPETTNKRLQPVCQKILVQPNNNWTLGQWAEAAHISSRTLSRLFREELGMSFVQYRQQVRLVEALKRLATGEPVTSVAMNVGFASLSAFNRLFKNYFGKTPGQFFC